MRLDKSFRPWSLGELDGGRSEELFWICRKSMPQHNVRPKVMGAIASLQTFTAGELMRRAGLDGISQAHNQIQRFREQGYLVQKQLPATGNGRPRILYQLTSDPEKRQKFAADVLQYSPPAPHVANEAVVKDVLRDAQRSLDRIENGLNKIAPGSEQEASDAYLAELEKILESAERNIATAFIEYDGAVSEERTPAHPAATMKERWGRVNGRLAEFKKAREAVEAEKAAKTASIAAARVIAANGAAAQSSTLMQALREGLQGKSDKAVVGRFLHEMGLGEAAESIISALIKLTCSMTHDPDVLVEVVDLLPTNDLAWLEFDKESAHILTGKQVNWDRWRESYAWLEKQFKLGRSGGNAVAYCCPAGQFTREAYVGLAEKHSLSVVAPDRVNFLGWPEKVESRLLFSDRHGTIDSFPCGYLDRDWKLNAYGIMAQDIVRIPGAPAARVAVCLERSGLSRNIEQLVGQIEQMVKADEMMIVVEGATDRGAIAEQIRKYLRDAHEVKQECNDTAENMTSAVASGG